MRYRKCLANRIITLKWLTLFFLLCANSHSNADENRFKTMCFAERVLISLYKAAISNPQASVDWDKYANNGLKKDSFKTKDGKTIRGLVWKAARAKGYLLIAQGTSMHAAEIYEQFEEFRNIGLDVYLYDYRGYGESSGIVTTLEGIISDYSIRINALNNIPEYKEHYIFGISLGGVIFSNAIKELHADIDGVVFDSVPHAIPWYAFCPSEIDPIALLPNSCANWLIIGAKKDKPIGRRASKLAKAATEHCGAQSKIEKHFGHIFMDNHNNTRERISATKRHFGQLIKAHSNKQQ